MKASQHIGERIRLLRMKKGLSQEQLALHAGINTSYLGQIERGEKNPTINTLEKIASGLQLSLSSLITGEHNLSPFLSKIKKVTSHIEIAHYL